MTGLLLALAGGLGAVARFEVDSLVARRSGRLSVPAGTLVVNVTACFLLGLVTGWASSSDVGQVLGVGFLGGYSTFSTASVEAARLLRAGRARAALLHAATMLVLSLTAAALGLTVTS